MASSGVVVSEIFKASRTLGCKFRQASREYEIERVFFCVSILNSCKISGGTEQARIIFGNNAKNIQAITIKNLKKIYIQ